VFSQGLVNLSGLNNLDSIGDHLQIGDPDFFWNTSLTDLSALQNLEYIGGALLIYWNKILPSLAGLENVDGNSIQIVEIIGNPELSECSVASLCDYLVSPNSTVFIGNNAPGCNSIEEVEEGCEPVGMLDQGSPKLSIRPNPARGGIITLTHKLGNKDLKLICFNVFGQQMCQQAIQSTETKIDIRDWPSGLYLVVVYEDRKPVGRVKFVVR
jgi:hypothetical protein